MGEMLWLVRRALYGFVALVLILLTGAVLSASNRSVQAPKIKAERGAECADRGEKQARAQQQDGSDSPAGRQGVGTLQAHGEGKAKDRGQESPESEGGFLGTSISADAAVAVFTLALVIATLFLYRATRDLVKGADETARRQLRAYLAISGADIEDLNKAADCSGPHLIKIVFINSGQTPAYDFGVWFKAEIRTAGDIPEIKYGFPQSRSMVGKGMNAEISSVILIRPHEAAALLSRAMIIHVWGELTYKDSFESDRHFRFYCRNSQNSISKLMGHQVVDRRFALQPTENGYQAN